MHTYTHIQTPIYVHVHVHIPMHTNIHMHIPMHIHTHRAGSTELILANCLAASRNYTHPCFIRGTANVY